MPTIDPESESDDSDTEDKIERRDSTAMLDSWLAELDNLTVEIDPLRAGPLRFSSATLEDTQEDELNAILGELSALQMNLDREIKQPETDRFSGADPKIGSKTGQIPCENGSRTNSPDNDSGFSDNASLLSSGSSLSASGSSSGSSTTSIQKGGAMSPLLPASEDEKREKIRQALEKMRAANVTRLYVKAFSEDGSSKALMVDETMTCGRVLALLADKNHVPLNTKWALTEHLPHLQMERIYEDHENMVENLLMWTRDSKNKLYFITKDEKYDVFSNPQRYLESRLQGNLSSKLSDRSARNSIIEEFFSQGVWVPDVDSQLFLKAEGKKAWKKFPFVLRASGVYYYPKGKVSSNPSKDLVCLASIDANLEAYQSFGWKKKFKAPTEFGFALKPSRLQVKAPRHIKYLCAEDNETLCHWMVGLRLAKHGKRLWENYKELQEQLLTEDFETFEHTPVDPNPIQISTQLMRAENLVNMNSGRDYSLEDSLTIRNQIPSRKVSRSDDCNSSGVSAPATGIPVGRNEEGFESDAPFGGTIKRKPSTVLNPKIPLTFNTRSLVSEYITKAELAPHTLQRKRSGSGTSASGSSSTASISSCNSLICQGSVMVKPTINAPHGPIQITSGGDTFDPLEFENLPPPPPELLLGDCESYCQTQSQHNLIPTPPSFSNDTSIYPSFVPRNVENVKESSIYKETPSFASELSQRLKTRKNIDFDNSTIPKNTQSPRKPAPPTRSTPLEEPTPDFLTDLKRVMEKKWQIAQKCRVGGDIKSPHEILGFRFEPGSSERFSQAEDDPTPNSLNNVRAWVSQHYGNSLDVYSPPASAKSPPPPTYAPPIQQQQPQYSVPSVAKSNLVSQIPQLPFSNQHSSQNLPPTSYTYPHPPNPRPSPPPHQSVVIYENIQGKSSAHYPIQNVQVRNKKPPPPIPKRADSTHLSAHFVYN